MIQIREVNKFGLLVIPASWLVGIIVSLILYFALNDAIAWIVTKSYILGLIASLANFSIFIKCGNGFLKEVEKKENGSPVTKFMIGVIIRTIITLLIFAIVIFGHINETPTFNVYATLGGFLTVKAIMMIVVMLKKGKVIK
ncbi:MAG: ATP synthase subunit I [Anaeroplasmataceae bacterium]